MFTYFQAVRLSKLSCRTFPQVRAESISDDRNLTSNPISRPFQPVYHEQSEVDYADYPAKIDAIPYELREVDEPIGPFLLFLICQSLTVPPAPP